MARMNSVAKAVVVSILFAVGSSIISILIETAQSVINGNGLTQGILGGFGLTLVRWLSIQIVIVLAGAAIVWALLPRPLAASLIALLPATAFAINALLRGIEIDSCFHQLQFLESPSD
jgi:hypothetical protein